MRLSVFSHDSYQVGGDEPTHQPVEQLTSLRSIPNYLVFRPRDESEVLNSFKYALNVPKNTKCNYHVDKKLNHLIFNLMNLKLHILLKNTKMLKSHY
ncbi:hypothetical protein [Mycoplasmopsis cynos]|uniref:hypothetical protein n=1 Tax=Mycoplasmopsis cynos TaxID=171284 RepID=UPI0022008D46|nr:hypothetical protein [Mycoplasmopsis cynos]UWV83320.1 hypothetical protein NW067_02435 [Mycoplasmopsis cynos]